MITELDYKKINILKKIILCRSTKSDLVNNIIKDYVDNSTDEKIKSFIDNLEIRLNKKIEEITTGIFGGEDVN
jgi:hypothetical protein